MTGGGGGGSVDRVVGEGPSEEVISEVRSEG